MLLLHIIVGLVLCIGAFLWWWQRSVRLYWEKNGVSYIPGPPFIGALKDAVTFKKCLGELFLDLYNHEKFKDDPITGVQFFHRSSLILRHPELIKNIYIKDFPNFMDRVVSSDPFGDVIGVDNLFAVRGQRWRTLRHKLTPVFTNVKLKHLFHRMMEVAKILDQKLSMEIGDKPREYEMKELAALYITDIIAICAFGVEAKSLLNPNSEFYKTAKRTFAFNWRRAIEVATCFFIPELAIPLRFALFSKETNDFLRDTVNYVMEERIKSGKKRNDLIDILIEMREKDSELYKGDTLVAQAVLFLTAGYEEPSAVVSFALYELSRRPQMQEKLRKEIANYCKKYGSIQYESIGELEYLNCVVEETLRLYPLLPFLDRVYNPTDGQESYSLEPYHKFSIPPGMPVYISSLSIHRDPKYFPNPLEFIPERFSAENRDSIDQYSFIAFGLGPRNCLGARFAYLQVKLALFTILRNYRVDATERTPKTIEFDKKTFVLYCEAPLYMNVTRA